MINFLEIQLREESSSLTSLTYFKPEFMSLARPHPLWTTCGNNSYEVCKAVVQAKMLSGRYKTEKLRRHFSTNIEGLCEICPDKCEGSLEHILLVCSSLSETRLRLCKMIETREDIMQISM